MRPETFVVATRESGYRSTSAAIAELIDNAVQANATRVQLLFNGSAEQLDQASFELAVVDNGKGMTPQTLQRALQFGGSTRFDNREGLGRFGVGLPNASVSQARLIEVYSWSRRSHIHKSTLDVDAIVNRTTEGPTPPVPCSLPEWLQLCRTESGSAIVWRQCDNLDFRRLSALRRALLYDIGRIFRRQLEKGLSIQVDHHPVTVVDPTRLIPRPSTRAEVELLPPLHFALVATNGRTGIVTVEFAVLPVAEYASLSSAEKRKYGIAKGAGVSVLRAAREIASGWYFMGDKRRENYDDWWRCDISFDPTLDELFGVTHTKQGIRPSQRLTAILTPTLQAEARRLNALVRRRFAGLGSHANKVERTASTLHRKLRTPAVSGSTANVPTHSDPSYRISTAALPSPAFVTVRVLSGRIEVMVNENHPFFAKFYSPLMTDGSRNTFWALQYCLLALGRAISESPSELVSQSYDALLDRWSDATSLLLEGK